MGVDEAAQQIALMNTKKHEFPLYKTLCLPLSSTILRFIDLVMVYPQLWNFGGKLRKQTMLRADIYLSSFNVSIDGFV